MSTLSDYSAIHRELWPQKRPYELLFEGSPALGLMRKDTKSLGMKGIHITPQHGRPQGRSRQFATAQANTTASKFSDFYIKPSNDYGVFDLEGILIRSNRANNSAFVVDAMERETTGAMQTLKRSQHIQVCGDGTLARGVIGAGGITDGAGVAVITLATPNDVKNFELDMNLVAAATATGAIRSATSYVVSGINHQTGVITITGTAVATDGWAAGDTLFAEGDALNGATPDVLQGLRAWVPDSDPTGGESFLGVDRSVAPSQLAGWRFSATGLSTTSIYSTIMQSAAVMGRMGMHVTDHAPRVGIMNTEDKGDLLAELEVANVSWETIKRQGRDAEVYYKGISIETPIGPIDIFTDAQWAKDRVFLMNPDVWTYYTIGAQPEFAEEDGQRIRAKSASDDYEGRLVVHSQVACEAPMFNANISLL